MRDRVIGRCSICGGRVMQFSFLHIVGPFPPAECESCGAVERVTGPVIPMEPRPLEPPPLRYIEPPNLSTGNFPATFLCLP